MQNLAVLPCEKNLFRKTFDKSTQVVNVLGECDCNQTLALSLNKNGNNLSQIAASLTPLSLIVSHISRNVDKREFRFLGALSPY